MIRRIAFMLAAAAVCWFAAYAAHAAEITAPANVTAGTPATLHTSGSGSATLYVIGPGYAEKREIKLGDDVQLAPESLRASGQYTAILARGSGSSTAEFFVSPAKPASANFLARPSRVPVAKNDVISGVVFVFDGFHNLVLAPAPVRFSLTVGDAKPSERTETTKDGVAWVKLDSARRAGGAQFVASVDDAQVRRVVQQVASDPCNLRMKAQRNSQGIEVETDPVRDCSGNPVPDGTIVTFTQVDATGRSTVDARIKKGVAKAELPASDNASISVASGVVLGNEIHIGGGR